MPKYLIERDLDGAGTLSTAELAAVAQKSNEVSAAMESRAQSVESYGTDHKLFCVDVADDPEAIRTYATEGGFPMTAIRRIGRMIDPTTAGTACHPSRRARRASVAAERGGGTRSDGSAEPSLRWRDGLVGSALADQLQRSVQLLLPSSLDGGRP